MHTPEGIRAELKLDDGTWLDVSPLTRGAGRIRINRGRRDESGRTVTTLSATLEDPSGDFNPLLPTGPYYDRIGMNTQMRVSLGNRAALEDSFTRSVSNSWSGGAFPWTITTSAGAADADFDINGNSGTHTHPSANVLHYATADTGQRNHRVRTTFNLSVSATTGASTTVWAFARYTDPNNWYGAAVDCRPDGGLQLAIFKMVGGVLTDLAVGGDFDTSANFSTDLFALEFYVEGKKLYAKAWDTVTLTPGTEPNNWMLTATDTSLTTGNRAGIGSRRETGNTNGNLQVAFANFLAVPGTIRAHVEVPNLGAAQWTPGGFDVTMPIQGADMKRRLGSSGPVLESAMTRSTFREASGLVGWWPCEDETLTGRVASMFADAPPMNIEGSGARFGATSPFPGTASMITLGDDTKLTVALKNTVATGEASGRMLVTFPDAGLADGTAIMTIYQTQDAAIRRWDLLYRGSTGGDLRIIGYDQPFAVAEDSGYATFGLNGKSAQVQVLLAEDGADVDWLISADVLGADGRLVSSASSGTFTTSSVGAPNGFKVAVAGGMGGCSVGQLVVGNVAQGGASSPPEGYIDETAVDRFARLCTEEGIPYEIIGGAEDPLFENPSSMRMGPQRRATLLQNLEDIEDAEHGVIYGARHFCGLVLRLHHTLVNQTGPDFSYTDGLLTGEPFPVPDELLTANDVTATRYLGGKYRSVEQDTSLRTNALEPPEGIGRYVKPVPVNIANDSTLADVARWNRHVGTWQSARYPNITFDTHRTQFTQAISDDVDELDIGDYFSISDTPAWLEPGSVEQLMQGYTEDIWNLTRNFVSNCRPAGPYQHIAVRGSTHRRDSAGSTMNTLANSGATSLSVAVTGPLWATGAVNFNIMVAGSVKHVTNISGASSPQTFAVDAAAVNGQDKALPAGAAVHIHPQARRALTAVGMNDADPADPADTFVTGVDTPPAVWTDGDNSGTFTSATFIPGAEPVGLAFRAPHSGFVAVYLSAQLDNDNSGGFTIVSWEMRRGPIIGEGDFVADSQDKNGILLLGTDQLRASKMFVMGSLEPGKEFNIVMTHRRDTAGNASIHRLLLLVRPLRTQGGLPGSLIQAEPQAGSDAQVTVDTSTSTSYTTADMTPCGTAFVAPSSGKVLVHISSRLDNSGANSTYVSYRIGTGTSVGAGTQVVAPSDAQSLENFNVNQFTAGRSFLVTGLTAGNDYNVQLMHRVSAGTATLIDRYVSVEPVA